MESGTYSAQQLTEELGRVREQLATLEQRARPLLADETAHTEHPYIERVPGVVGSEPVIVGTRTPVRAIVERWKFGESPEVIQAHYPHLRLAQIFDALSYYDDHRQEIEKYILENRVEVPD
jgi:uncharacterized protein (DUF433 family)